MLLCPVSHAHLAVLVELHHQCCVEFWDEKAMAEILAMPGAYGFLALGGVSQDMPCGLILARLAADEAEILTFGVVPSMRSQGVGLLLLDAALTHAKNMGAESVFLEVAIDNKAAIALYRKTGFTQVGIRPRYYAGVTDALILKKDAW